MGGGYVKLQADAYQPSEPIKWTLKGAKHRKGNNMKSIEKTVKVFELTYDDNTWYAEIEKTPGDDLKGDLFTIWIYPENYGMKSMEVGEYSYGRTNNQVYEDLIDYLYNGWEDPEDGVYRNSFDSFMKLFPEDFDFIK